MNDLLPMGAVVRRELIRSLRYPLSHGLLAVVVVATSIVALLFYPDGDALPMEMRESSRRIYGSVIIILFQSAVFLLPPLAASSLVLEREQETYELLWLTMLGPWGIVASKTLNAVGYYLLMACAVLPVMCVSAFLVGIDVPLMIFGFMTVIAAAVASASIGVLCSAKAETAVGAAVAAYGILFLIFIGYMIPVGILGLILEQILPDSMNWLVALADGLLFKLSPVTALFTILNDSASASSRFGAPIIALIAQCCVSVLTIAYAARLLARPSEKTTYMNPIDAEQWARDARATRTVNGLPTFPGALRESTPPPVPAVPVETIVVDFDHLYESPLPPWPPVRDGMNPMLAREFIQVRLNRRLTGPRAAMLFLVGMAVLGGATVYAGAMAAGERLGMVVGNWMGMAILAATLIAPLAVSSCWAHEREHDTFDALRMTSLTPWEIVSGKFLGGLRAAQQLYVVFFACSFPALIGVFYGAASLVLLAAGLVTVTVVVAECVAFCLFVGLNGQRTPAAITSGVVWLSLLFAGPALALPMLIGLGDPATPVCVILSLLSLSTAYDLFVLDTPMHLSIVALSWLVSCLIHSAVAYGLLRLAAHRYEQYYARAD